MMSAFARIAGILLVAGCVAGTHAAAQQPAPDTDFPAPAPASAPADDIDHDTPDFDAQLLLGLLLGGCCLTPFLTGNV